MFYDRRFRKAGTFFIKRWIKVGKPRINPLKLLIGLITADKQFETPVKDPETADKSPKTPDKGLETADKSSKTPDKGLETADIGSKPR